MSETVLEVWADKMAGRVIGADGWPTAEATREDAVEYLREFASYLISSPRLTPREAAAVEFAEAWAEERLSSGFSPFAPQSEAEFAAKIERRDRASRALRTARDEWLARYVARELSSPPDGGPDADGR